MPKSDVTLYDDYSVYQAIHNMHNYDKARYVLPAAELLRRHHAAVGKWANKPVVVELFSGKGDNLKYLEAGHLYPFTYRGVDMLPHSASNHIRMDVLSEKPLPKADAFLALYYSTTGTCFFAQSDLDKMVDKLHKGLKSNGVVVWHMSNDMERPYEDQEIEIDEPLLLKAFGVKSKIVLAVHTDITDVGSHLAYSVQWKIKGSQPSQKKSGSYNMKFSKLQNKDVIRAFKKKFKLAVYEMNASLDFRQVTLVSANKKNTDYYLVATVR